MCHSDEGRISEKGKHPTSKKFIFCTAVQVLNRRLRMTVPILSFHTDSSLIVQNLNVFGSDSERSEESIFVCFIVFNP
mgnify:CR=1 FL=1